MMPLVNGQRQATLGLGWVFLGLTVSCLVFLYLGITIFQRRIKN